MEIVQLTGPDAPDWVQQAESLAALLGGASNPALFPPHFVNVVLPRLGGYLVRIIRQDPPQPDQCIAGAFLLPRLPRGDNEPLAQSHLRSYTLRYHSLNPQPALSPAQVIALVEAALPNSAITFYDPAEPHTFDPSHEQEGAVDIGRPSAEEAEGVRALQRQIWGSPPESLYPSDIHSVEFGLGISLVARVEGRLAGFLFGFAKFGGKSLPAPWQAHIPSDLRLESQTLGVLPEFRGMRIGALLKKVQAETAWKMGIHIVNWTADPLQYPNAALNFGLLRAVAFEFHPDYYPFRNALNRGPASRFGITWLVGSARVRTHPISQARALILDLAQHPHVQRVNNGYQQLNFEADAPIIAIEVPADWTTLQEKQLEEALRWRESTDRLFAHYVGTGEDSYVITGVATDQERRFLLGERANDELWERLTRPE